MLAKFIRIKPDSLTKPIFQRSSVSEKAVLLTGPIFQNPAVSKKLDLLTKPKFQGSAVSKKADSLTGDGSWRDLVAEAYGSWELGLAESDMRMETDGGGGTKGEEEIGRRGKEGEGGI